MEGFSGKNETEDAERMENVTNKIVFDRPSTQDTKARYTSARFGQERDNKSLSEDRKPCHWELSYVNSVMSSF